MGRSKRGRAELRAAQRQGIAAPKRGGNAERVNKVSRVAQAANKPEELEMHMEPPVPQKPTFHLVLDKADDGSSNMLFRWCLAPDTPKQLREKEVLAPYLFVAYGEWNESLGCFRRHSEERKLIPLSEGHGLIQFHRPGKQTIMATIVWASTPEGTERKSRIKLHNDLLNRAAKYWTFSSFRENNEGQGQIEFALEGAIHSFGPVVIEHKRVDESSFAAEPPAWLKWWVNLWHEDRPRNECNFRGRLGLSFLKWIPVLVFLICRTVFGICAGTFAFLCGRRTHFSVIIHPFDLDVGDIGPFGKYNWNDVNNNWVRMTKRDGDEDRYYQTVAPGMAVLLTPLTWICIAAVAAAWLFAGPSDKAVHTVITLLAILIGFVVFMLCNEQSIKDWSDDRNRNAVSRRNRGAANNEDPEKDPAFMRALDDYYARRVAPLACAVGEPEGDASFASLPPSHQTLSARFQEFKPKVCKPFRLG